MRKQYASSTRRALLLPPILTVFKPEPEPLLHLRFASKSHLALPRGTASIFLALNRKAYLYSGSLYNFAMAEYNNTIITILMKYTNVIVLEDDLWEIARFVAHRPVHRRASVVNAEAR